MSNPILDYSVASAIAGEYINKHMDTDKLIGVSPFNEDDAYDIIADMYRRDISKYFDDTSIELLISNVIEIIASRMFY